MVSFGKMYFEVAILLRNSLFVSSLLCNSEVWFNLTNAELNLLESVDLMLLRKILNAPKSTPKEMMYLELGVMPLREIIKQRRLNYLKYILDQESDSILFKVFEKQVNSRTKKDWVTTVLSDLEVLNLNVTFADVQEMNKNKWRSIVKQAIKENALKNLQELKTTHSKVKMLEHVQLKMQDYLSPNIQQITKEEIQMIFKIRSKVLTLKMNQKGLFDSFECEVCNKEDETQEHIYKCEEIWKNNDKIYDEIPDYDGIMTGNIKEKLKIARILKDNMQIHKEMKS